MKTDGTGAIFTVGAALGLIVGMGIGSLLPWNGSLLPWNGSLLPWNREQPPQYSTPYSVKIVVDSEITQVPYTEDEERDPILQNLIDQCEKREIENCHTTTLQPEFSKQRFDRSADETVS